ncbi:discoidin domain-containing protein [Paenibacillus albicereus]|uniref:Discoidin domain-containing protein n=1 Tax=Paenibacillus albicereus TaxID=2726185 RepID=A0A6H2H0T1_9BACL|nr:discoidin domain-containing protein [Paenibacillus albicereus]QJC53270.1 discoidin domain-containing protein [Paenibacillus albicereus]
MKKFRYPKKRLSIALLAVLLTASSFSFQPGSASASWNKALGRYAWASSGSSPANGVDGVPNTFWQPSGGGQGWLTVDLGSSQSVQQIVLKSPAYGHWVEAVSVLTSDSADDGSFAAQTSGTYAFYSANSYTVTIQLPNAVNARYVRVNVAPVSTATTIGELEVYGP